MSHEIMDKIEKRNLGGLEKQFLKSLKKWENLIAQENFTVDTNEKIDIIVGLINKFIFMQTLDNYGVIQLNWIKKCWERNHKLWEHNGKSIVLEKFFAELDDWFYRFYDMDLFKGNILEKIQQRTEDIDRFYKNIQSIIGLSDIQSPSLIKGITQFNFRDIDEDVFGKSYETFLGEVRGEEGIYYTPKIITQFITNNTVCKLSGDLLNEIRMKIENKNFEKAKELVLQFISIKILDPACGSGAFLIKTVRILINKYLELIELVKETDQLTSMKHLIGDPKKSRVLIARIILRHIYANDLDRRAVEVAKANLWLEAIKFSVKNARYEKLPPETMYHLPDLEINLRDGDSLVGLPDEITLTLLNTQYREELIKLTRLRQQNLENPLNLEVIGRIETVKKSIRDELDARFKEYLTEKDISTELYEKRKPFHWAFEFWFLYFDANGGILPASQRGFDVIVGNPPYGIVFDELLKQYLTEEIPTFRRNNDNYVAFSEKSLSLLKEGGYFSFILPNTYLIGPYYNNLKDLILSTTKIRKLIDFGINEVFQDPHVYNSIVFLEKESNKLARNNHPVEFYDIPVREELDISQLEQIAIKNQRPQQAYHDLHWRPKDPIIQKMERIGDCLIKDVCEVKDVGFNYWTKGRKKTRGASIGSRVLYKGDRQHPDDTSYLKGRDVVRYGYTFGNHWLKHDYKNYLDESIDTFRFSPNFLKQSPKIIYRQTADRIIATIDENRYYLDKTVHLIIPKLGKKMNLYFLLGLLNSHLILYFYKDLVREEGRAFAQVKTVYLKAIPLKFNPVLEVQIAKLVQTQLESRSNLLDLGEDDPDQGQLIEARLRNVDTQIDELIFRLYEITEEEKHIINK